MYGQPLQFQKSEADLNLIILKLDNEFSSETSKTDQVQKNPAQTLKRLAEIKQEYAAIVKEAQSIKDSQMEAMQFFKDQLGATCQALIKLQLTAGTNSQMEKPEELSQIEKMLGMTGTAAASCSASGEAASVPVGVDLTECEGQQKSTASEECVPETPACINGDVSVMQSAYERREHCSECLEINDDEFNGVSSLIRGRVKLMEVNQIYKVLWNYFKTEKHTDELSPQGMYKMGLRVTGQTGEAKLKVLRALKLLNMSKKGAVKLL